MGLMGCDQGGGWVKARSRAGPARGKTGQLIAAWDQTHATKATSPSKGFYIFGHPLADHYIVHNTALILYVFLLYRLKNKPCKGAMNVRLFLGLLEFLQTKSIL
jgi:hypothetical protein